MDDPWSDFPPLGAPLEVPTASLHESNKPTPRFSYNGVGLGLYT